MSVSSSTIGGGRTKYKIIFLGDQSVGKSSIIEKYIKDRFEEGLNVILPTLSQQSELIFI
jgi:GTPase SAR1 family protein